MNGLLLDFIIIVLGGGITAFTVLRIFYKNSILFTVGLFVIIYALLIAMISEIGNQYTGLSNYLWAIPLAISILIGGFMYLNRRIKTPMKNIINTFKNLQSGDLIKAKKLKIKTKDEFGEFAGFANNLIDGFNNMARFAQEIGRGNLDAEYKALGDNDILGNSLMEMKESLKKARDEEEKRKKEDERISWINEGHAKFGDILRTENDNDKLYDRIISKLVEYIGANQGGLFLVNDEDKNDKFIELVAMYAYQRKKYVNKRLEVGESLVGQCVLEGETIFMTDIPQDYIKITSGLGDANPSSLLIIPLKFNEEIYGVLELASFSVFDKYTIDFIEKLSESIASTISTHKINQRTKKLLEESKVQSEELAAQEEEIRQNMEELQTTQEESARRETEMNNLFGALNKSALYAELKLDGTILTVNDNYAQLLKAGKSNIEGLYWTDFIKTEKDDMQFIDLLEKVKSGESIERKIKLVDGTKISETYTMVKDADDQASKILNVGLRA